MEYGLPIHVAVAGDKLKIRYDFRVILDIFEALNDIELSGVEKISAVLQMFYIDFDRIADHAAAIEECFRFIDGGTSDGPQGQNVKLMDWEADFSTLIAPINRVVGCDIRGITYNIAENTGGLHWWTFLSAYLEIGGECLFAQIVQIRDKLARGKALDKTEREWYRKNRKMVDFKVRYTKEEDEYLKAWGVK
jgi:Bacteriophage Gp15 protein.